MSAGLKQFIDWIHPNDMLNVMLRVGRGHITPFSVCIPAGITNFDLLGEYGRLNSLHNFYIVLAYNATFGVATSSCLVNKFTASVRNYIVNNVRVYVYKMRRTTKLRPAWNAVNVVATANGTATGSKTD